MKFLKENSYDIVRLYINQVGIAIFSLVLYFSVAMLENDTLSLRLKVAISVFAMIFYFALLYTAAWDMGAKDKIRIDAGRAKENKFKGGIMSLIANAPNFLLAVLCAIAMAMFMSGSFAWAGSVSAVLNLILRMTCSMYLGLMQGMFIGFDNQPELYNLLQSCGFIAAPLLAVFSTQLGYYFGLRNKKLFSSSKHKVGRE